MISIYMHIHIYIFCGRLCVILWYQSVFVFKKPANQEIFKDIMRDVG